MKTIPYPVLDTLCLRVAHLLQVLATPVHVVPMHSDELSFGSSSRSGSAQLI